MNARRDCHFVFVGQVGDNVGQVAPGPCPSLDPDRWGTKVLSGEMLREVLFRASEVLIQAGYEELERRAAIFALFAEAILV